MCSHIHFLSQCPAKNRNCCFDISWMLYFRKSSYILTKSDKILQRCQAVRITNWFEAPPKMYESTCKYSGKSIHNDDKY